MVTIVQPYYWLVSANTRLKHTRLDNVVKKLTFKIREKTVTRFYDIRTKRFTTTISGIRSRAMLRYWNRVKTRARNLLTRDLTTEKISVVNIAFETESRVGGYIRAARTEYSYVSELSLLATPESREELWQQYFES